MSVYGPYNARVDSIHDGDTLSVTIDLGFSMFAVSHDLDGKPLLSCRVYGINAPELATDAGKAALAFLQKLCPLGTRVKVLSHGWDKYGGRFDGEIILPDGTSVGPAMLAAGQAVPLAGA